MTGLPASLSIGLWIAGSVWIVAIFAMVFDAPREIVYGAFGVGILVGVAEWLATRRIDR